MTSTLANLQLVGVELTAALVDGRVWFAIFTALLFGGVCLALGTWVARRVGLLEPGAPVGEMIGVGLGSGLLIVAVSWAAVFSGGRSAFTPVAIGFAITGVIVLRRRIRRSPQGPLLSASASLPGRVDPGHPRWSNVLALLAGAGFVVLAGLLYGSTMAPSPRDGVQPVEFMDEAYYSALGADLARTGTETIYSPSGFAEIPGLPAQTWYHWGELWLAAIAIALFGLDPILARHYVVLPLVLLAAAALTGTIVRRLTGTSSRRAFLFGAVASLFLAPIPLPGPFFSSWATGLVFGITSYGLAAVVVLLILYVVARHRSLAPSPALSVFSGSVIASILPAHIVIALLAVVGTASVLILQSFRALVGRVSLPGLPRAWSGTLIVAGLLLSATAGWGILTGHGIGTSGLSSDVLPFNDSWRESVGSILLGSGALLAIPVGWLVFRKKAVLQGWIFIGAMALLGAGALAWGARLGDFTMFHVFFGGIAVFATPVAAVALWMLLRNLRRTGRLRLAAALVILCGVQLEVGVLAGIFRMQQFGPHDYQPISVSLLAAIEQLPPNAKLAYACAPSEEVAIWDPRLVSIDAHTGRPVVPMCFEAETFGALNGTQTPPASQSPLFREAPQRTLYPTLAAQPSPASVAAFLKQDGIDYIYADSVHPNSLVPGAVLLDSAGGAQVLRIP